MFKKSTPSIVGTILAMIMVCHHISPSVPTKET